MNETTPRKHSKFSASGAERWFNCSGSVKLSEGIPSKDSVWSLEGTKAHEVFESLLKGKKQLIPGSSREMYSYGKIAADHVLTTYNKSQPAELLVEKRVSLEFIHPEAFGTLDASVVSHFDVLHIMDLKYGMTVVSPKDNLQFLFYALGVAHMYDWNFKSVRMWTLQPRVKGFDGFPFWEIGILELKRYANVFKDAVERVEKFPEKHTEGPWCHWCNAKSICPLKREQKQINAKNVFKGK